MFSGGRAKRLFECNTSSTSSNSFHLFTQLMTYGDGDLGEEGDGDEGEEGRVGDVREEGGEGDVGGEGERGV